MKKKLLLLIILCLIVFTSCKDEDVNKDDNFEPGTNQYVNNWIYDNLSIYYYWEDDLPAKSISNNSPEDFFYDQLSDKDRFSWIQPNFIQLLNSLQGINTEAGYEYLLFRDADRPEGVIGQIVYIKEGSPAENVEGIKRGDLFTKINGSSLTLNNFRSLLGEINLPHTLSLKRYFSVDDSFQDLGDKNFTTAEVAEKPILLDTVYEINNKKIGYLIYNLFSVGPTTENPIYLNNMDAVFAAFKAKGIQHLILDLRYNSGGAESATINLASLIGAGVSQNDVLIKRDYNELYKKYLTDNFGEASLLKYFVDKPENIGSLLANKQLIVLTSTSTASASELLVNGLRPYMDVFLIGDTTVGKNVGSTTIYDKDDPDNTYGIQPIITKSFNARDKSDYDMGFYPDIAVQDFGLEKKELGNEQELLLNIALNYVAGGGVTREKLLGETNLKNQSFVFSSFSLKRNFGVYNITLEQTIQKR